MARPSDCADLRVINQLDGFSAQPRITIPFTGDIDLRSANSQTVYLVKISARIKQSSPAPIDVRIGQADGNAAASVAIVGSRDGLGHGLNSGVGKNPQACLTNLGNPAAAGTAIQGQSQIGAFFASHGARVADPDGPDTYAEVPLSGLLPEGLNFIP